MGNCLASEATKRDKEIARKMQMDEEMRRNKVKILLLGAGESGKSTLFKQMKLLYSQTRNFSTQERNGFKQIIYGNIVLDSKILIRATESHTPLQSSRAKQVAGEVMKWPKDQIIGESEAALIRVLWKDKGMQKTWNARGDIQVQDAYEYYMNELEKVSSANWVPDNQDILRSRARTSGVVSEQFIISNTTFEMYDVGGQRNERRKWIHHFDGVTTVLFVAAISEYNQKLYEDQNVNRQTEAVELFRQQLELETFKSTPFILFLNKADLFRQKIAHIPFRVDEGRDKRNVDFQGPHCDVNKSYNWSMEGSDPAFEECYSAAVKYLARLYENQSPPQRGQDKKIYAHPTNSTDSQNIEKIMTSCKEIILNENLFEQGWL